MLDETWLTGCDLGRLSVTQKRDLKSLLLLDISLVEEFLEQELSPFDSQIKWSRLCRYISRVD